MANNAGGSNSISKIGLKKKHGAESAGYHKHSISNGNARSMNNFLSTEPLAQSKQAAYGDPNVANLQQPNNVNPVVGASMIPEQMK